HHESPHQRAKAQGVSSPKRPTCRKADPAEAGSAFWLFGEGPGDDSRVLAGTERAVGGASGAAGVAGPVGLAGAAFARVPALRGASLSPLLAVEDGARFLRERDLLLAASSSAAFIRIFSCSNCSSDCAASARAFSVSPRISNKNLLGI